MPSFIDFLKTADLFKAWVEECPLSHRSNHAPEKADVLGALFLSAPEGHTRYAHMESVRYDAVNPQLLGMTKVVSSSSARRASIPVKAETCTHWFQRHLHRCYGLLLCGPWILDVDWRTVRGWASRVWTSVMAHSPSGLDARRLQMHIHNIQPRTQMQLNKPSAMTRTRTLSPS